VTGRTEKRKAPTYVPLDAKDRRDLYPVSPPSHSRLTPESEPAPYVASAIPLPYEPEPVTAFDPHATEDEAADLMAVFAAVLFAEEEF
jgi:hypothetical protein